MTAPTPPLTWLRAFESAARHLSFTRAADELNLTQSAISQHVRALEERFQCALFIRKHRALILTDQGRRLLPGISQAIDALATATAPFEPVVQQRVLTVAASPSIVSAIIMPNLLNWKNANPQTSLRLITGTWPDEFSNIDADVEIRFDTALSADPDAILLKPNRMQIVAAPNLIGDMRPSQCTPDTIMRMPLVQVLGTADNWQSWARQQGASEELRIATFVDSHGMAVDIAKQGVAVAYTHALVCGPALRDGSLILLAEGTSKPSDGYYLRVRKNHTDGSARQFANWLQEQIKI